MFIPENIIIKLILQDLNFSDSDILLYESEYYDFICIYNNITIDILLNNMIKVKNKDYSISFNFNNSNDIVKFIYYLDYIKK